MPKVTVIGGGVGGMVCALLLARRGHRVRLYERLPRLGGKLAEHSRDGFTFSLGPSLLTLPGLFADLGLELDLVELDELCRYRFADGSTLTAYRDPALMAAEVERLAPGEGRNWLAFHGWARGCFEASRRTFFTGPLELSTSRGRPAGPAGGRSRQDPRRPGPPLLLRPAAAAVRQPLRDVRGFRPVPGTGRAGVHPGDRTRRGRLVRPGRAAPDRRRAGPDAGAGGGGDRPGHRGDGGARRPRPVNGVRLTSGERERADVVVANTDAAELYGRLLPDRRRLGASPGSVPPPRCSCCWPGWTAGPRGCHTTRSSSPPTTGGS